MEEMQVPIISSGRMPWRPPAAPCLPVPSPSPTKPYWDAPPLVCPWILFLPGLQSCNLGNSSLSESLHPGHLVLTKAFHASFCQLGANLLS